MQKMARGRRPLCGVVIAGLLLMTSPALASQHTSMRKAGRGLAALTTGFLEVPGQMLKTTERDGVAMGFTLGLAEGVGRMVPRYLVGVYELLTCPLEAPVRFQPILEPEFPWGHFEE